MGVDFKQPDLFRIPTIIVGKNTVLRTAIEHVLSGTPFVVPNTADDSSGIGSRPDAPPTLFILARSDHESGMVEFVTDLKAQHPTARVMVLADRFDLAAMLEE